MEEQRIKQYAYLISKGHEIEATWLRQILALAAGALALLAGLGPYVPPEGPSKYFLATTWVGLGLGIIFGAVATYIDADRATKSAVLFGKHLLRVIEKTIKSLNRSAAKQALCHLQAIDGHFAIDRRRLPDGLRAHDHVSGLN